MKRCIICGNVDDDNSTVCSTCGNPYVDMGAQASDMGSGEETEAGGSPDTVSEEIKEQAEAGQPEAEEPQSEEEAPEQPETEEPQQAAAEQPGMEVPEQAAAEQPEAEAPRQAAERPENAGAPGQTMPGGRPPRRTRSGPQIYGQAEGVNPRSGQYANQGMIRREVPPRAAGAGRADGRMQGGQSRPMGRMQGGQGRPMGQMQGGPGRPSGQDFRARR